MSDKKLLDKSPLSGIAVPIAIVLVGALIIFGVTKMLASGKDHRDLVEELNSKTFGNRWVAAYELSKYLASSRIPKEDVPWVAENLAQTYRQSVDARTRNFVVIALGTLNDPHSHALLNDALGDEDSQVRFNAVVGLGNLPIGAPIAWDKIDALLASTDDVGLKQALLVTIASHQRPNGKVQLTPYLVSQEKMLRYSAAMGLIYYPGNEMLPVLHEVMSLGYENRTPGELNGAQVEMLKLNILTHVAKTGSTQLLPLVGDAAANDSNIKVSTKAREVANLLKN